MGYSKYIYPIAVSVVLGYIYNKYKGHEYDLDQMDTYANVRKYLLTEPSFARSKKPLIWIHMEYEKNARWWPSFGSRTTEDLNQPYQYLTIQSIIDKCGADFNVCLIDDDSFAKLIPDWAVNLHLVADPIKSKLRQLALARVLHTYGGLLVPSSFLCAQSLRSVYDPVNSDQGRLVVGELMDRTSTSQSDNFCPSPRFMGCQRDSPVMAELIAYLEPLVMRDFTAESDFRGLTSQWLAHQIQKQQAMLVSADQLGVQDKHGAAITLDRLMGNTFIELNPHALGLYVPYDEILKRTAYQWFARLSAKQVLQSDTMVGKYILVNRNSTTT
jgi:hypothetical protein